MLSTKTKDTLHKSKMKSNDGVLSVICLLTSLQFSPSSEDLLNRQQHRTQMMKRGKRGKPED